MNIKLEQYKIFHEAASTLSFSIASRNLFISQSAVSQAIKQLEKEMHTKLFIRNPKGVSLTNEGKLLYSYISNALELITTAENKISNMLELTEGQLIIGAGDTIVSCFLLPYLEQFHRLYPKVKLQVINRTSLEVIDLIKTGKIDIGFLNLPIDDEALQVIPCIEVHDIFIGGTDYKDSDKLYTMDELSKLPLILLEKNSNTRNHTDEQFHKHGIVLQPEIEIGAHELLLQFAHINLGVSCAVKEFSEKQLKENYVYELKQKTPLPARNIGYAYSKRITLNTAANHFLELLSTGLKK